MKKGSKFIIGLAVATLTFGTLWASLGPQRFAAHCGHWKSHHGYHQGHHHGHGACETSCGSTHECR